MLELKSGNLLVNDTITSQNEIGSPLNFAGKIFANKAEVTVH